MPVKNTTLISWSSGKDRAWTLGRLQWNPDIELPVLCCRMNARADRIAMHDVRSEWLRQQANAAGLPPHIIEIPDPGNNRQYENVVKPTDVKWLAG